MVACTFRRVRVGASVDADFPVDAVASQDHSG
jgi:hypothetical protein